MMTPEQVYTGLRERFLTLPPVGPPNAAGVEPPQVYALMFEVGARNATTTLTATVAGDASLYLSIGGGILGGGGVPEVRAAARRMVEIANELIDRTDPEDAPPGPALGEMALVALTSQGPRVLRSAIATKFAPSDPLIALVRASGVLIQALRQAPPQGIAVPG